jgi:hypothetical protein
VRCSAIGLSQDGREVGQLVARELDRRTSDATEVIGLPRVSIQDALRAMMRTCIDDPAARGAVLARLQQEPHV